MADMPYRVRIAPALTLGAIFALLATFVACGGKDGASAAAGTSSGPRAFADESYAELATDGDTLWLAVTGYRQNGAFGLKVFEKQDSAWVELTRPPGEVSGDLPVSFVSKGGEEGEGSPCLGYSTGPKRTPVVACLEDGAWKQWELPVRVGTDLIQIGTEGQGLNALVSEERDSFRLLQEVDGEWIAMPRLPRAQAVAQLAIKEASAPALPAVGFATQQPRAKHLVYQLRGETWHRLIPIVEDVGVGPLVGGPVLIAEHILFPVTQADSQPWSFWVQSARLGKSPPNIHRLSRGAGNAQGQFDLAGGRVWATWQEDAPLKDRGFRSAIYAAELSTTGRIKHRIKLWQGVRIGPGSTQVLAFEGKTLALYMRASDNGRGLQATMRAIG
jgi:hypothetical protein